MSANPMYFLELHNGNSKVSRVQSKSAEDIFKQTYQLTLLVSAIPRRTIEATGATLFAYLSNAYITVPPVMIMT